MAAAGDIVSFDRRLDQARAVHRAGRLGEADAAYSRLHAEAPDSADLTGLMAMLAFQQGQPQRAKDLWRQSLALPAASWIRLRDLNNLLITLVEEGLDDDARALASTPVGRWPDQRPPDDVDRSNALSLFTLWLKLGETGAARRLGETMAEAMPGDVDIVAASGSAHLADGDLQTAGRLLRSAEALAGSNASIELLTALSVWLAETGKVDESVDYARRACIKGPLYQAPRTPTQRCEVLVLSPAPMSMGIPRGIRGLHTVSNYPAQAIHVLAERFHFTSLLANGTGVHGLLSRAPRPAVVINNLVNAETLAQPETLEGVRALLAHLPFPIINPPEQVLASDRVQSSALVSGLDGIIAPVTAAFFNDAAGHSGLIGQIEAQFSYPTIMRAPSAQEGVDMVLVRNRAELAADLFSRKPGPFYVTAFVENRSPEGFYRKIRAAVVGEEILIMRVDFSDSWMVHGRKKAARQAFYASHMTLLDEEKRICADIDAVLSAPVMARLRALRNRISLDVFGIDFDVTPDGRILFFEANASMNLFSTAPAHIDHPRDAHMRLVEVLSAYIVRRAEQGPSGGRLLN